MIAMVTALVCLSLAWSQAGGSHIPVEINQTIHDLLRYYKSITARMLYMGGVLETYDKMIGQMLIQLPTSDPPTANAVANANGAQLSDVKTELRYILKKIQELKRHRFNEQQKLLNGLQALRRIQTDDVTVQSKALWELPWLYEEASSLSNNTKEERRRRRRRQAKRVKGHLRG
ncbi:interferon gamma-like isoform X3 [Antennarius striatus]|uniref:interferon gamma-like isoform X3 n=1 Tax=Antennarius striatus TaxID=241820 RepID=UPI0035B4D8F6